MTVYFQGAEKADFVLSAWTPGVSHSTASTSFVAANSRASLIQGEESSDAVYMQSTSFSATEFWTHFKRLTTAFSSSANPWFISWRSGGTPYIGLQATSGTSVSLRWWNGSSWVTIGSFVTVADLETYDVYIKVGNPGQVRVYKDNLPVASSITIDTTFGGAVSAFDSIRMQCATAQFSTSTRYAEVIVADWNTIGSKLVTRIPDAAGTYSEWGGAGYTSVDELTEDNTMMASGTVDQRFSVTCTDFPALGTGESIEAVKVAGAIVKDAGGPQSVNFFTRVSGTDYHSSDQAAPASINGLRQVYDVNPNTSAAWTVSELNAAEFGVRSRT